MKHTKLVALVFAISFFINGTALSQSFKTLEAQSHEMMEKALSAAIDDIRAIDDGTITLKGAVCPHAMMALSAVGSGAIAADAGRPAILAGMARDQADMMIAQLGETPWIDLGRGGGISVSFKLSEGVEPDTLIEIAKAGIQALQ